MSVDNSGPRWSDESLFPAILPPQHLDIYDLRGASFEVQLAVTVAAGVINRSQARIYLVTRDDDIAWLDHAFHSIPQDWVSQTGDAALPALLQTYGASLQGYIIYDSTLPDTINVATTLAGQQDSLIVSPELSRTIQETCPLPLIEDLRVHGWRTRLQAYHWAAQHLLPSAGSRLVAGVDPHVLAGLRSFLVASCTFVYWLDSRNYLPDFSAGLLSERALMQQILGAFPPGSAHLGWFIDESSGVHLTSRLAMVVLASDFFTNLEVWTALRPGSVQAAPLPAPLSAEAGRRYISFTMSDGDNLQYLQHRMFQLWNDPTRGRLPIGWTFSPVTLQVVPAMAAYYTSTATTNDELIVGPSGAGYMYPSHWPSEQLPEYLRGTGQLMQAMNMTTLEVLDTGFWQSSGLPFTSRISLTGMVLNDETCQRAYVQTLTPYGLRGILSGSGVLTPKSKSIEGTPLYHNLGLANGVQATVAMIKGASLLHLQRPSFMSVYVLAWTMTPSDLLRVMEQLGDEYEAVLPATLLAMLAQERAEPSEPAESSSLETET